jgi:hypothetical protein
MSKHTCQEGGRCKHPAKFRSPAGLLVCGVHRRSIDDWYARRNRSERCEPLK